VEASALHDVLVEICRVVVLEQQLSEMEGVDQALLTKSTDVRMDDGR